MSKITMCGYRCDLCKAFATNIKKNDQREMLSAMWQKYYDLNIPANEIYCDGCRCDKPDAKRVDMGCPVRQCVIQKELNHCGECEEFPCEIFGQREGLCYEEAKKQQGNAFDEVEYNECLLAYDNKTRLDEYIKANRT